MSAAAAFDAPIPNFGGGGGVLKIPAAAARPAQGSIQKLQRVQNTGARIVLHAPRRSPAQPLLEQLHWLPVRQRIDYKLAVLTHKIRATSTPSYLSDHVRPPESKRKLRSSTMPLYFTDRLREHISPTALSDIVHPLSGTLWTLKYYTKLLFARRLKTLIFRRTFTPAFSSTTRTVRQRL